MVINFVYITKLEKKETAKLPLQKWSPSNVVSPLQISRATLSHNELPWMQSNGVNVIELLCICVMEWLPSHPHNCVTLASIQYMRWHIFNSQDYMRVWQVLLTIYNWNSGDD
jgi:hypothetical protein